MGRSRARLTSAGSTAYNQETLVIPLSSQTQPCRRTDGHDDTLQNPHPIPASSSSQPNKTASKQNRAARHPPRSLIHPRRDGDTAAGFLKRFLGHFPHRVHTILTD